MAIDAEPKVTGRPPEKALEYLRAKKLKVGFDFRDVWREEHVRAFTVAKAMKTSLLQDIKDALDSALENGTPFAQFQKELMPQLEKRGWTGFKMMTDPATGETKEVELGTPRRLRIIYDANMRTARAVGQWDRIQRTKDFLPYLGYELGPSERHRPEHVALNGTILPIDDSFWQTHFPPNGWGCKCRVRQMGTREVDSRGGVSKRPEIKMVPWVNKRTGEETDVPKGIDPGWDFNPGMVARSALPEGA